MSSKNDVFEFPEDNSVVHTNLADYPTELLDGSDSTTKSTTVDDPPNQLFLTSLLFVGLIAFFLSCAASITRAVPIFGSLLSIIVVLILREWNRIFGDKLTPRLKASINFSNVLKDNKEYIPFYDMGWLFGGKYKPYCYGCTGPAINSEMCRTPDDPDSRSPTKERETGDSLKKGG